MSEFKAGDRVRVLGSEDVGVVTEVEIDRSRVYVLRDGGSEALYWSQDRLELVCLAECVAPSTSPVTAPALLSRAADLMAERGKQYDKPEGERSMVKAVQAFNAITGRDLSEPEGWLLLQVLKDVRLFQRDGYHADSAEDCIAYAALKAEARANA